MGHNQASPKRFPQGYSLSIFFEYVFDSHDISVQAPYPYSVTDQFPGTRQSGSRRVSKSTSRTLDCEESGIPSGLPQGNTCHKSTREKRQRGSLWQKRPTSHILIVFEASRSSPSIFLGPSAPLQRKGFIPFSSRLQSWPTTRHGGGRPNTYLNFSCVPSESRSEFCTLTTISNRTPRGRT